MASINTIIPRVIFLDVDGVLNDLSTGFFERGERIDEGYLRNLAKLVAETGYELVLSSSWRFYYKWYHDTGVVAPVFYAHEVKEAHDLIEGMKSLGLTLSGITDDLNIGDHTRRPEEIYKFIQDYKVQRYLILDDEVDDYSKHPEMLHHFLKTITDTVEIIHDTPFHKRGLTDEMLEKALDIVRMNENGE